MLDLAIIDGFIVDGTGNPGYVGDIGIRDGKIVQMGQLSQDAKKTVNASGRVVCPGFIDPHTHEELTLFINPVLERYMRQGVTTCINGNCGTSIAPTYEETEEFFRTQGKDYALDAVDEPWGSLDEYRESLQKRGGLGFNHGLMVGHNTIRWSVMGFEDRPPTSQEMEMMKDRLLAGLDQGALGMSTGLVYVPGRAASTDEVMELVGLLPDYDATYATHVRGWSSRGDGVAEAIQIGRQTGATVQVSHLNCSDKQPIGWIEDARQRGVEIACDIMPHSGGHVYRADKYLYAVKNVSFEYRGTTIDEFRQLLKKPESRQKVAGRNIQMQVPPEDVILIHTEDCDWENRSVAEIAQRLDCDPTDLWFDLMIEEEPRVNFWMAGHQRNKTNLDKFPILKETVSSPVVCCGSDAMMPNPRDPYGHYELQRNGVFPTFLDYNSDHQQRFEYVIQRLTSLPAQQFRLKDRGLLREGFTADINVFDPDEFYWPSEINPNNPFVIAQGMDYVCVNGKLVIDGGALTDARPGRVLLKD